MPNPVGTIETITLPNGNTYDIKDTTYGVVTSSANGLMSSTDKVKLDSASVLNTSGPSSIVAINDAIAANAHDLRIDINPVQSGSGDPSPTNIRTISGWTGANINVSDTTVGGTTYSVSWQTIAGTVYGGVLDVTLGLLTVNRQYVTIDHIHGKQYDSSDPSHYFWYTRATDLEIPNISDLNSGLIADRFVPIDDIYSVYYSEVDGFIAFDTSGNIRWKEKGSYDFSEYNSYLANNPFHIVYEIAEPQTYQITPIQVSLLAGTNYIWADTGNTVIDYLKNDSLRINEALERRMAVASISDTKSYLGIS